MKKFLGSMIIGLAFSSAAFAATAPQSLFCEFSKNQAQYEVFARVVVPLAETGALTTEASFDVFDYQASIGAVTVNDSLPGEKFNFLLRRGGLLEFQISVTSAPLSTKIEGTGDLGPVFRATIVDLLRETSHGGVCVVQDSIK